MPKTLDKISLRVRVKIVPCDGYEIRPFGAGEYLVVKKDDTTRNVILDSGTVAGLVNDHLDGVQMEEFNRGLGTFWRIEEITEV